MNAHDSADNSEMIGCIASAFDERPLPPAPAVDETIAWLRHADGEPATPSTVPHVPTRRRLARLSWGRVLAGGLGLVAACAALVLLTLDGGRQLSAMERMEKELRDVQSYSYRVSTKDVQSHEQGKGSTTHIGEGRMYWRAPGEYRYEMKITRIEKDDAGQTLKEELVVDFVEIAPAGKDGVFIDHVKKTYARLHDWTTGVTGSVTYPLDDLRMIRENSGDVLRELGTKKINGKQARGYVIALKGAHDDPWKKVGTKRPPETVWVDATTDLPLEYGHEVREKNRTSTVRDSDFRWNIEIDAKLFDATLPADYKEVFEPAGEEATQQEK